MILVLILCEHLFLWKFFFLFYIEVKFNDTNVSQSTTYPGLVYDAEYAVDKDVTTCARTEVIGTTSADASVWWRMDLGVMSIVQRVNIMFKNYDGYGKHTVQKIYIGNFFTSLSLLC